jgi:hypothetical protein
VRRRPHNADAATMINVVKTLSRDVASFLPLFTVAPARQKEG